MANEKSVLVIGLNPTLIDFSQPGYALGMDATKALAGLKSSEDELTRLGYSVQMCLTDFGGVKFPPDVRSGDVTHHLAPETVPLA